MTAKIPLYQADAFADSPFTGNPAAVCITDTWLRDALMQNIAAENNLSETAFVVPEGMDYGLRWFTPVAEVDLCGHATLAAAYILFRFYIPAANEVRFHSQNSGILTVRREGDVLTLDFPADEIHPADPPAELLQAFASAPAEILKGNSDYLLVFSSQQEIEEAAPDMSVLLKVPARGIIITAST
jgi:PhzF family phenazine biosynthesis protein